MNYLTGFVCLVNNYDGRSPCFNDSICLDGKIAKNFGFLVFFYSLGLVVIPVLAAFNTVKTRV